MSSSAISSAMRYAMIQEHNFNTMQLLPPKPTNQQLGYYIQAQKRLYLATSRFPVVTDDAKRVIRDYMEALDEDSILYPAKLQSHSMLYPYVESATDFIDCKPEHLLGCHWYALLLSHTAGGSMMATQSDSMFFKIARDQKDHADILKESFDAVSKKWSPKEKSLSVSEVPLAFAIGQTVLRYCCDA